VLPIACAVVAHDIGNGYIERLPNHAGYFLVGVDDAVNAPAYIQPRRTALVVFDGLGHQPATTMKAVEPH